MTVENLHDAIGLLPSDLITAVDEKRSRKPKVIPFKRYAAMAACVALLLCGSWVFAMTQAMGGAKETAMATPELQAADSVTNSAVDAPAAKAPEASPMEAAPEEPAAVAAERGAGEPEEDAVCGYPTIETYAAGEIPPEGVAAEEWEGYPEFPAEDVQYANTKNIGTASTTSDPVIRVLRSRTELEDFRERFGYYTMEAFDACCEIYDESWFEHHDLLVVLVRSKYEDGHLSLASVTESDGAWCIRFYSGGPYTGEQTSRFVLAALDKGIIPEGSHLFAMFEVP